MIKCSRNVIPSSALDLLFEKIKSNEYELIEILYASSESSYE